MLNVLVNLFLRFRYIDGFPVFTCYDIISLKLAHLSEQRRNTHPTAEHIAHRAWNTQTGFVRCVVYKHDFLTRQAPLRAILQHMCFRIDLVQHHLAHNVNDALRFCTDRTEVNGRGVLRIAVALQGAEGG